MKATDVLTETLRSTIGPELRAIGFRGSGQHWSLPNVERDHALMSFQRWTYSDASEARSTVNLRVVRRTDWALAVGRNPWLGARPTATTYGGPGWQDRLGMLLDPAVDRWWTIRSEHDVPAVVADVGHLVRDVAVPHLRARLAGEPSPGPFPWPMLPTEDDVPLPPGA